LLCRFALKQTGIDAASFTSIRLFSGALMLWLIVRISHDRHNSRQRGSGNWLSALASAAILGGIALVVLEKKQH
jgi:hypothetical protein